MPVERYAGLKKALLENKMTRGVLHSEVPALLKERDSLDTLASDLCAEIQRLRKALRELHGIHGGLPGRRWHHDKNPDQFIKEILDES